MHLDYANAGVILGCGFTGFLQLKKMRHKIDIGASNGAHKILAKDKY